MMQSEHGEHGEYCEECGTRLYQAGERVSAGTYLRVDDGSFQRLRLSSTGPLPASFDGHVALYRAAAAPCVCERRRTEASHAARQVSPAAHSKSVTSTDKAAGAARVDSGRRTGNGLAGAPQPVVTRRDSQTASRVGRSRES